MKLFRPRKPLPMQQWLGDVIFGSILTLAAAPAQMWLWLVPLPCKKQLYLQKHFVLLAQPASALGKPASILFPTSLF